MQLYRCDVFALRPHGGIGITDFNEHAKRQVASLRRKM
jgi:hypothetical protein